MNRNLIKLDDNYSFITDQNGNVFLISKENERHRFEDILLKENECENLIKSLNKVKEKLATLKRNNLLAEFYCFGLVGSLLVFFQVCNGLVPINYIYLFMAVIYFSARVTIVMNLGTRLERFVDRKKCKLKIEDLELQLSLLMKEITDMKNVTKFKRKKCGDDSLVCEQTKEKEVNTFEQPKFSNSNKQEEQVNATGQDTDSLNSNSEEEIVKEKVKVLTLSRRN